MNERALGTADSQHPAPFRDRVGLPALGFGIVGAPLAWNIQLLVGTALVGRQCYPRYLPLARPMWTGSAGFLLLLSALALVLGVVAALVAWRSWTRTREEQRGSPNGGKGRTRFMALCGMLSSGLFLLALVFTLAVVLLVPPCMH